MNKTSLQWSLAAALAVLAAVPSQAQINTGKPTGGVVGADTIDASDWMAESFTLGATTTIDSILTYVNSTADDTGLGYTVAIYGSKTVGGALVPSINFQADNQGQLAQFTATYQTAGWTGQSGLNWTLAAGTYFVAIETDGNGVQGLVLPTGGLTTLPGAVAFYTGGQGYDSDPAISTDAFGLQVTAAAVPEPASMALLLLGLGALGFSKRRRSRN